MRLRREANPHRLRGDPTELTALKTDGSENKNGRDLRVTRSSRRFRFPVARFYKRDFTAAEIRAPSALPLASALAALMTWPI